MEWKYVKKIKDVNSIKEIENKYSIQLPVYLKNIIIKYNGGRPLNRIFDTNREKEKVMKSLLSYNVEDKENVYFLVIYLKGILFHLLLMDLEMLYA